MTGKKLRKIIEQLLLTFCMLKIYPAYVSKYNTNHEKQVILLMIPNGEGWNYLAVKKLSVGRKSKHHGGFYCLNCIYPFSTENKFRSNKKVFKNKDVCSILMPSEDIKVSEVNQYQKSDKAPFIIYADLKCLMEKIDRRKHNTEKSFTRKVSEKVL